MTSDRGFSLVELLVVLAIMGVLATGVSFVFAGGRDDPARLGRQMQAAVAFTRSGAIAGQRITGLAIYENGLIAMSYGPGGWQQDDDHSLQSDGDILFGLDLDGMSVMVQPFSQPLDTPQIIFTPDGSVLPFTLYLIRGEQRQSWHSDPVKGLVKGDNDAE